jgi:hypothetical protein
VETQFVSLENVIEAVFDVNCLDQNFYDYLSRAFAATISKCGHRVPVVTGKQSEYKELMGSINYNKIREIGRVDMRRPSEGGLKLHKKEGLMEVAVGQKERRVVGNYKDEMGRAEWNPWWNTQKSKRCGQLPDAKVKKGSYLILKLPNCQRYPYSLMPSS